MKKRYLMYMHSGSGNHGCEALARTIAELLDDSVTVFTKNKEEDKQYIKQERIYFEETGSLPPSFSFQGMIR